MKKFSAQNNKLFLILSLLSFLILPLSGKVDTASQAGNLCDEIGETCCVGLMGSGRVCGNGLFCSVQVGNGVCQSQDPSTTACDQAGESCCNRGSLNGGYVCGGGFTCTSQSAQGVCQLQNTSCDQEGESCCNRGTINGGHVCDAGLFCSDSVNGGVCQTQNPGTLACDQEGESCCNRGLGGGYICGNDLFCSTQGGGGVCQKENPTPGNQGGSTSARIGVGCPVNHVSTAIGCIPIGSSSALITFLLSWALGISGGVAMLALIYSGFLILTSSGDPKRLATGQELVVSSLSGIVLLAFSVFILRIIGVDILGLFG